MPYFTPRSLTPCVLVLVALGVGCSSTAAIPDLGGIYNRAAQEHGPFQNPVVVIPGILGSRLVDRRTGTIVWGAFGGDYARPDTAEGARLFALPMEPGKPLLALADDVEPDGVLRRLDVSLFGLPIELQAYVHILAALGVGGFRDETLGSAGAIDYGADHFTCFQFDYDWRRDNAENAVRLHEFLVEKRAYVRAKIRERYGIDRDDIRFDVIAHSMGGLITRYYLQHGPVSLPDDGSLPPITWGGASFIERCVLIGTPNAGSVRALEQLVTGIRFSRLFPRYAAAILGTFPSIYQLLPRERHRALVDAADPERVLDPFDPALWQSNSLGLASPDEDDVLAQLLPDVATREERLAIALDAQRKCLDRGRQFTSALDRPISPPANVRLYLVAGDAVPTGAVVALDRARRSVEIIESGPGDGTVIRSSALLDERVGAPWSPHVHSPIPWRDVQFLFTDHLGLTRDPGFTDRVLYLLLEDPRDV
jgi:pimeloyl-ACP methyl ester carboxylesterase